MKHPRTTRFGADVSLAQMAAAAPRTNKAVSIGVNKLELDVSILSVTDGSLPPGAPRTDKADLSPRGHRVDKADVLRTDQDEPANFVGSGTS